MHIECYLYILVLDAIHVKPSVLYKDNDAIFHLRPEGPSHKRGGLRRVSVSHICTG